MCVKLVFHRKSSTVSLVAEDDVVFHVHLKRLSIVQMGSDSWNCSKENNEPAKIDYW